MKIVITAPSLDPNKNVSGISSIVRLIIKYGNNDYIHCTLGQEDNANSGRISWLLDILKKVYAYKKVLDNNDVDIVHMNIPCNTKGVLREYLVSLIAQKKGKPILMHLHGGEFLTKRSPNLIIRVLFKKLLNRAGQIVVLDELEKQRLNEFYNFSTDNVNVIRNGVEILPKDVKQRDLKDKKLQIIFIGRIDFNKGLLEIEDAMRLLAKEFSFKFVVCGDGPQRETFVEKCSSILGDNFSYQGVVFGQHKTDEILASDIFLLPSYFEGLPMALLETMAAGLVPVVTPVGAMSTIVQNHVNGLIVEVKNTDALYENLKYVFLNKEEINTLSSNAIKTIEREYNIENTVEALSSIYAKLATSY